MAGTYSLTGIIYVIFIVWLIFFDVLINSIGGLQGIRIGQRNDRCVLKFLPKGTVTSSHDVNLWKPEQRPEIVIAAAVLLAKALV